MITILLQVPASIYGSRVQLCNKDSRNAFLVKAIYQDLKLRFPRRNKRVAFCNQMFPIGFINSICGRYLIINLKIVRMFFVIATLLFVSCQSQQRKADNSGQDTVKTYYPDRSIENITLYKAGRKDGPSIDYYKDGKIKGIMIFKRDEPVDLSLYYHPNGKLGHIFYYDSLGNLTGLSKIWYDNGALRQVTGENNKDSVQSWKYFYYSGKLREEAYYRNRKKTGLWKYYTEDGDIYKTETYYDDRLLPDEKDTIIVTYYHDTIVQTGWKREYNKTGQWTSLKKETHYRNGMPDGYTVEYFESGDIKTINHYKYGLLSGKQFEYYYPNKLKQISYYKQGKKTGEWIYYSKEGNIVKKEKYRRDVLVN